VADRKQESSAQQGSDLRRELRVGNFSRSVQLPGGIRPEDIQASFENGILTVEIPKARKPEPIKIAVSGKTEKRPVGSGASR
jgi:HSP20 family protein